MYICFEGTEGVGKTTQVRELVEYLQQKGYRVLQTKEPGTVHLPLTMKLRNFMLNKEFEEEMSPLAREYISQAIRSIHIEKLIKPAIKEKKYDYIIQDRGLLSGLAYGEACGNPEQFLITLMEQSRNHCPRYDVIVLLMGNVKACLEKAQTSKTEFEKGDVIESKGSDFMEQVKEHMFKYHPLVTRKLITIDVTGKNIKQVSEEVIYQLF